MMGRPIDFKRMVLGLPQSAEDYASVAFTAELAELLGLDLVGVFAVNEDLVDIAAISCVRELHPSGVWHRLDAEQLQRGSNRAAADARRLFDQALRAVRLGGSFDLAKGQIGDAISSRSMPDDIVVVIEPKNPVERVTYQFQELLNAALRAPTATLLIPSHVVRRRGPIVAVATSEHDSSIRAALKMAEASHEKLLVLMPPDADAELLLRLAATTDIPVDRKMIQRADLEVPELSALLTMTGERFVVISRGADARLPSRLAAERAVPVLVTEPIQKRP